ncbi:MAG TPA: hypothetical protein VGI28_03585 [Stellaceae bacterium]
MTYTDLDELKAAFAAHASHCQLVFTGTPEINVIATNRGESPIAILRPNDEGAFSDDPRIPGSPAIWRVHSPRNGLAYCEATAVEAAQYIASGGLLPQ